MPGQISIKSQPVTKTPKRWSSSPANPTQTRTGHKKSTSNVGEVAGGTTADICVVCCCCPCVVFEFLILAVYKLPATAVRRMWKSQRQKILTKKNKKKGVIIQHAMELNNIISNPSQQIVVGYTDELSDVDWRQFEKVKVSIDGSADAVELDKQMWNRFKDAGFWRSPSQRT